VTEVPEHLLKRSRDRKAALGGGGDSGGDAPAASTPAVSESTEVAPKAAAPVAAATPAAAPEPVAPYVEAALKRKKIPFWAMPMLAFFAHLGHPLCRQFVAGQQSYTQSIVTGSDTFFRPMRRLSWRRRRRWRWPPHE